MVSDLEVITMGRVSVDLYPEQINVTLAGVKSFAKSLGGSPTNVAVAAARLGRRSAVITKVGDDGFGIYVRQALAEFGVDPGWVGTDPTLRTPIVFCEVHPPDNFPLLFYRQPKAPDMNLAPGDLDLDQIALVPLFWATGSGLSDEPSRAATMGAFEARAKRPITVLDLDYRPGFWPSADQARYWAQAALRHATVAVGNLDEVEMAVGTREPVAAALELLKLGPTLAIVKMGLRGVLGVSREERVEVPPIPIETLCGLGAGDAFGGALCDRLLAGAPLAETLAFANAAGAIVASRLACADAMPTPSEVTALIREYAGV